MDAFLRAIVTDWVQTVLWPSVSRSVATGGQTQFTLPSAWNTASDQPIAWVNGNRRAAGTTWVNATTVAISPAAVAGDVVHVMVSPGAGSGFLARAAAVLLGNMSAGGFRITDLADPAAPSDAVSRSFMEAFVTSVLGGTTGFLRLDGGNTPSADVPWGGNNLTGLPTAAIGASGNDTYAVSRKQLRDFVATAAVPTGALMAFAGTAVPSGFLACDGQAYDTASYPSLYAAIGYTYGSSGAQFRVPDLRIRVPVAEGTIGSRSISRGTQGGATDVTLTENQIPPHSHTYERSNTNASPYSVAGSCQEGRSNQQTAQTGGGQSHENMPPYTAVPAYIIKT